VRFEAPARADRCGTGQPAGGVVLQGASGGNGVLVWLRYRDSLASGDQPLLQRADTMSPSGAIVAVRFVSGSAAHGVPLDSGTVSVTRTGSRLSARARGVGLEVAGAGRVTVDASFEGVPLGGDTVPCRAVP
jgi:hypothetical protein